MPAEVVDRYDLEAVEDRVKAIEEALDCTGINVKQVLESRRTGREVLQGLRDTLFWFQECHRLQTPEHFTKGGPGKPSEPKSSGYHKNAQGKEEFCRFCGIIYTNSTLYENASNLAFGL